MSDEPVTKTLVGQCVGIIDKPGTDWTEFEINHGGQYTTKVSTKVAKVIEEARAVGSEVATWTFKQSNGKENPHKPGTFYQNRWLDKVEAGAVAPAAGTAGGTPLPSAHHDAIAPADKDRTITRQTCIKAASALYSGRNFETQLDAQNAVTAAAARFEIWVYRDIDSPDGDGDNIPF